MKMCYMKGVGPEEAHICTIGEYERTVSHNQ
jgi:hypothetical protein